LLQIKVPGQPLIITEYGLSVSPGGPGNWGYGGNSLTEQQEGILHMYKSLVDGGASGSCVFNYSDGWWKGGNEFVHDDVAEEWFGLVQYTSLTDTQGQERPVWEAVKMYQSAVITQPKSSEIYTNQVPVEVFLNDTVDRIDIYPNPAKNYFTVTCNKTQTPHFALKIFNAAGILVRHIQKQMWDEPINISNLKPGMYHILITMNNHAPPCMKKLILF